MNLQLVGRSALITGGGAGIGRAVALCLAAEGVDVCLAARSRQPLEAAAAEINAADHRGRASVVTMDTTSAASVEKAVGEMLERLGRVDILVNIGGMTGRGTMALSGLRNAALSHMTKTVSDLLGPLGITCNIIHPGVIETPHIHELYTSRAEREGRTPADIEQEYVSRTPVRRVLQAEEVGNLIAFLASPLAGGITGESIGIDGGISRHISL